MEKYLGRPLNRRCDGTHGGSQSSSESEACFFLSFLVCFFLDFLLRERRPLARMPGVSDVFTRKSRATRERSTFFLKYCVADAAPSACAFAAAADRWATSASTRDARSDDDIGVTTDLSKCSKKPRSCANDPILDRVAGSAGVSRFASTDFTRSVARTCSRSDVAAAATHEPQASGTSATSSAVATRKAERLPRSKSLRETPAFRVKRDFRLRLLRFERREAFDDAEESDEDDELDEEEAEDDPDDDEDDEDDELLDRERALRRRL